VAVESAVFQPQRRASITVKDRSQAQKDEKGAPMVRIKDVAEHAGVSTVTVSRVINGKSVRPRFRKAVERW